MWNYTNLKAVTDDALESFEYREILESRNTTSQDEHATYHFHVADTNARILYSGGYLQQQLKIVKANNDPVGGENVTLVNGGGLLRTSTLTIGTTKMDADIDYSSLLMQVMALINFTPDYATSEPTMFFFLPDDADSADRNPFTLQTAAGQNVITGVKQNDKYNRGFGKRWAMTKDSQSVHIWIPLKYIFGFLNDFKKVLTGFEVKMDFHRNPSVDMLFTNVANPDYKVVVEKISLWLPYVKFSPSINKRFDEFLHSSRPIDVVWRQPRIVKSNILENASGSCSIPATSDEVLSLYVVPQYDERNESFTHNNMIFDHLDMTECWLMVNNVRLPVVNYTMDFGKKDYSRLYAALLQAGQNNHSDETGCLISYETFGKLYPIICFDLSAHESYTELSNLMIEFHWRLQKAPGKKYVFYFVLVERKLCQISMADKRITSLKTLTH